MPGQFTAPPAHQTIGTIPATPRALLYTSTVDSRTAHSTLSALHRAATAAPRGWTVVHELYDLAPTNQPRHRRTGWLTAVQLLTDGTANGLIAPAEQEIAWFPADRAALRAWLLGLSAFAVYLRPSPGPAHQESRGERVTRSSTPDSPAGPDAVGHPREQLCPALYDRRWVPRPSIRTPAEMRSYVATTFIDWGVAEAVREDLELIVSELTTNSLCRTRRAPSREVVVDVMLTDDEAAVAVTDRGPYRPLHPQQVGPYDEHGRGLTLVRALASRFEHRPADDGGTTVEAAIALRSRHLATHHPQHSENFVDAPQQHPHKQSPAIRAAGLNKRSVPGEL
ncbi:ATP-binding protein [Streptomyces sp. PA5.6]|uniref:ATP-binding protein n=1 Tax=Streptomyces sp. PA5.6 TaxID=3035651 RepID=UPI0039048E14